jgi:hypothetical protein
MTSEHASGTLSEEATRVAIATRGSRRVLDLDRERGCQPTGQEKVGACDCKVHRNAEEARSRKGMVKSGEDL